MEVENDYLASFTPDLARLARDVAGRAEALAAEITDFCSDIGAPGGEPVRYAGFRCNTAADHMRQAVAELLKTAVDLDRIKTAAAPGPCRVSWGVCPEHGNTLTSSAGKTWCRTAGCDRTWE
jgi:hypothetical protein